MPSASISHKGNVKVSKLFFNFFFAQKKLCFKFATSFEIMAYGVTGNTSDFGSEESRFEP